MPLIGSPQGISVPVVGVDSDITAATKIVNALNTLIGAVEGNVPISALTWSADKSAGNNGLYGLKFCGLESQAAASANVGRLENVGGNLYWITAAGALQITDGASIDVAAVGGITGDYGGVNPAAVSFSDASSLYEFTTDPGVYAHVKANQFWITGSGAGITKLDSGATATDTWTFPALPGSTQILQVSSAGAISASNTIGNAVTLSSALTANGAVALNAGATLAAGQTLKHPDIEQQMSLVMHVQNGGTYTPVYLDASTLAASTGVAFIIPAEVGTRIKAIKARYYGANGNNKDLSIGKVTDGTFASLGTIGSTTSGWHTITVTLGTPEVVTSGVQYFIAVASAAGGVDELNSLSFVYDRTT